MSNEPEGTLTEVERRLLHERLASWSGDSRQAFLVSDLAPVVEHIATARLAKQREQIAQEIEAMKSFAHGKNPTSEAHLFGYGTARRLAARIARGGAA